MHLPRSTRALTALSALVVSAITVACGAAGDGGTEGASQTSGALGRSFEASARTNHVSRDLMVAIAQTEGGLTLPAKREVELNAAVPIAGPMELRHGAFDSLARGASLMQTTELALRQDADLGLEAGARVLAEVGARRGATEGDLSSWSDAIEQMSGYADAPHREHYAHRVFALLARGGTFTARDGEAIVLAPHPEIPPHLTFDLTTTLHTLTAPADYGPAEWFPTPQANKWTPGRGNGPIDRIVIHDTEGGWDASVSTLQNDPNKSVHYIVGQDGRVGQFVSEGDTAWHGGNWFYNQKSVGIEHVGYATQSYPDAEYAASALLVKYLAGKYGIPKDRTHIIGHDQIPNGNVMAESSGPCEDTPFNCEQGSSYGGADNHRDPGDFEWCLYMVERVGCTCKCNDIWSLWNCSSDHTEAFRCDNGNVEIEHCDGAGACESQAVGMNDVCHLTTPTSDAGKPPTPAKDAGVASLDAGSHSPPPNGSDAGAGVFVPPGASGNDGGSADTVGGGGGGDVSAASGCSVTVATGAAERGTPGALLGLALGLVGFARARRKR